MTKKRVGPAGRRVRREFSPEFKAQAVRMIGERRALEGGYAPDRLGEAAVTHLRALL